MRARAVVFDELGGPRVLRVDTVEVPDPGPGEVRIRIEAFGLNRAEAYFREGWHPLKPVLPSRIGMSAAGRVESIGPGVQNFAVGDAVSTMPLMDLNKHGAYGEVATFPLAAVAHNPPELDMVESASLWASYMTAYGGLVDLVTIKPGDAVLLTAASSSVGAPAIQIVNMLGGRAIAVTRKRSKADAIRAAGAEAVIVLEDEDLVQRVNELTNDAGVPVVFDAVVGAGFPQLAEVTAPYGTIIIYGVLAAEQSPLPLAPLIQKNLSIVGYAMYLGDRPERNRRALDFIYDGVTRGLLRPQIAKRFSFDQVIEAAEYLDSMEQIGKVVVTV